MSKFLISQVLNNYVLLAYLIVNLGIPNGLIFILMPV